MIDPRSAVADDAVVDLTQLTFTSPRLMTAEAQAQAVRDLRQAIFTSLPRTGDRSACLAAWEAARTRLVEAAETRAWPLPGEVKKAFAAVKPPAPPSRQDGPEWRPDTDAVEARRINAGEPCAESSLFGARADRMIASGAVTLDRLEAYRRGAWEARRALYGREKADAWLLAARESA